MLGHRRPRCLGARTIDWRVHRRPASAGARRSRGADHVDAVRGPCAAVASRLVPAENLTRIAAYAICTDDTDRVLLARWVGPAGPSWTLTGGGLDFGEHPEVGAVRELTEETGYIGVLEALLGVHVEHFVGVNGDDLQSVRIVYRGRVTGGELTYELDGSTDLAAWVPRADIADLDAVTLVHAGMAMASRLGTPLHTAEKQESSAGARPLGPVRRSTRQRTRRRAGHRLGRSVKP